MWYTKALRAYLKTVGGRIHAPGKGVIAMTLIEVLTLLSIICQIICIMQDSNKRK